MWSLRRASLRLRCQRLNAGATRAPCVNSVPTTFLENERGIHQSRYISYGRFLSIDMFCSTDLASLNFAVDWRGISSQAGASSTKEDDGELEGESNDESDADLSDGDEESEKLHDELELSDDETGPSKKQSPGTQTQLELFKEIVKAHGLSVDSALDKWVEQGKELGRKKIMLAMRNLRRRKMYRRALQLLLLYKLDKKKIADVLLLMEEENVKPCIFTYRRS